MSLQHAHDPHITVDAAAEDDTLLDAIELPPPAPVRPRVLLVGSALASAGVAMAFATLIGIYVAARQSAVTAGKPWIKSGVIPLTGPDIALVTLALSVVTVLWAVYSTGNRDRQNTWVAVGLTVLLGVAFLNATTFIYTTLGLGVSTSEVALLLYTITGAHLVIMAVAIVFVLIASFRTLGNQDPARGREAMAAAALFWCTSCAIFAVIWYTIYITK